MRRSPGKKRRTTFFAPGNALRTAENLEDKLPELDKLDADKDGKITKEESEKDGLDPEQLKTLKEKLADKKKG